MAKTGTNVHVAKFGYSL